MAELILGSNPAVSYASGHTMARVLWDLGTEDQKRFADLAIEREWGATMVLTAAERRLGNVAGRTRAIEQPDGTLVRPSEIAWFITSAEHDLADNIFHLVLARPEGRGPGTKGLSMFLVPITVAEDGTLGERNSVFVTTVDKMGLKASTTTCELTFGAVQPGGCPRSAPWWRGVALHVVEDRNRAAGEEFRAFAGNRSDRGLGKRVSDPLALECLQGGAEALASLDPIQHSLGGGDRAIDRERIFECEASVWPGPGHADAELLDDLAADLSDRHSELTWSSPRMVRELITFPPAPLALAPGPLEPAPLAPTEMETLPATAVDGVVESLTKPEAISSAF